MKSWQWALVIGGGVFLVTVYRVSEAIGKVESAGRYDAIGPATAAGDRAYGKYQIMGANIPSWSLDVLGVQLTPDQFLNDPSSQDTIGRVKIGQLIAKYAGRVEDVASAWFSGQPLAIAAARRDVTGTSVTQYVARVKAALGLA